MKSFELNNHNLSLLQRKSRLYSYLNSKLDKTYFKLSSGLLIIALCSGDGLVRTVLNIDYNDIEDVYFSLDYNKWQIALQKFSGVDTLKMSLNKSLLKMYVEGSEDVINLGVIMYDEDSMMARQINNFIPERKNEIVGYGHLLDLTPELLSHFDLMNNLFTTQNRVNSIGLSPSDVVYSDRSVVVRASLSSNLPEPLFSGMDSSDNHIYLHTYTLKLFDFLSEFNDSVYFDNDYEIIYWGDGETDLVLCSDSKNVNLPTEEQFMSLKPLDSSTCIDVDIDDLRRCLDFFKGFYEESSWKPLKFNMEKGKEVLVSYRHPTAEVNKTLVGVISDYNSSFVLDAETLRKIITKVRDRFTEGSICLRMNFDDDSVDEDSRSPGVYCTIGDNYEFMISKLLDD